MTARRPLVNPAAVQEIVDTDSLISPTSMRSPNGLLSGYAFLDGAGASTNAAQAIGASAMILEAPSRVIGRRTLSTCVFEVTTLGTNLRVGLASVNPATGDILAIVHDFGQIDVSGTGMKTVSGLTDVLTDGWYAGILVPDTTGVSLRQYTTQTGSHGIASGGGVNAIQARGVRNGASGQYTSGFTVVAMTSATTQAAGGHRYLLWTWA